NDLLHGETLGGSQGDGDGRVDVAPGNPADGEDVRHDDEGKRKADHTEISHAELATIERQGRGYRAGSDQDQEAGPDEFRGELAGQDWFAFHGVCSHFPSGPAVFGL